MCRSARSSPAECRAGTAPSACRSRDGAAYRVRQCGHAEPRTASYAPPRDRHPHGARRRAKRVVRQVLTESCLLALMGGSGRILSRLSLPDSSENPSHPPTSSRSKPCNSTSASLLSPPLSHFSRAFFSAPCPPSMPREPPLANHCRRDPRQRVAANVAELRVASWSLPKLPLPWFC